MPDDYLVDEEPSDYHAQMPQGILFCGRTWPVSTTTIECYDESIDDLSPLAGLPLLENLFLRGRKLVDLTPLAGLNNLVRLSLEDTKIVDLAPLAALQRLEELTLRRAPVEDLTPLANLPHLKILRVGGTQAADHERAELQKLRPRLVIED